MSNHILSSAIDLINQNLLFSRDNSSSADANTVIYGGGCPADNEFNGHLGARISSIFVILAAGTFGALFPVLSSRWDRLNVHPYIFFCAKYFGSGVVIATALIHLLQPANQSLSTPCLGEAWQVYPYAFGIALVSLFGTFLVELVSRRYLEKRGISGGHDHGGSGFSNPNVTHQDDAHAHIHTHSDIRNNINVTNESAASTAQAANELDDMDKASTDFVVTSNLDSDIESLESRQLAMQLGSIFIFEFGIIFHSIFIGLTLAVSGDEFSTLYAVLIFHQMFEGFGLGTRLALAPWPGKKRYLPWFLGALFGVTTPLAIAIGLGIRTTYPPGSTKALVTNGIFDSISAGILLYVGLVELLSNEFLHAPDFKNASNKQLFSAYAVMVFGAGIMALLGRWA